MKLEIGPGQERLGEGWQTVSSVPGPEVDFLCEWGMDALPFPAKHFDEVYASHVIEHVGWMNVERALVEAWRVLKPGGFIEIHTIDFARICSNYATAHQETDRFDHPLQEINYRVFAYPKVTGDRACANWHHSLYDREYLEHILTRCGFHRFERIAEPRGPEKHGVYNLGLKAVKA